MSIDPRDIETLKVYPPLGIARVGNASGADDYILAAEVVGSLPTIPCLNSERVAHLVDDFRTPTGEIKRQAVRFRVYAHMTDGRVIEVTEDSARIEWRVAVANLKAGWYEFSNALDLPAGIGIEAGRRNAELLPERQRSRLDIVPTPRAITGRSAPGVAFQDGTFYGGKPVYLGELRTDDAGRLIFLGGRGLSAPFRAGNRPTTFANNDGWHDDVSDGPIRATVTFPNTPSIEAEPGYIVVAPPNFAPGIFGLVTGEDAVHEVFRDKGWINASTTTSCQRDVLPILQRMTDLQWVNHGLFISHGFGSPLDARDHQVVAKINDRSEAAADWRQRVFRLFRRPDAPAPSDPEKLPQIYGDNMDGLLESPIPVAESQYLSVTRTQYEHLERWATGQFVADCSSSGLASPPSFSALQPSDQVYHLERAALHECLGGPFHPAIELTWVMRLHTIWSGAYRLKVLPGDDPAKQDWGDKLTLEKCVAPGGAYDGVAAGALTRPLGVPWQTDHTSCNSDADYRPSTYLSMPTFWGPRAPDQVLSEGDFKRAAALISGASLPLQAVKHLANRVDWLRDIRGVDYYDRIARMVLEWSELGMVLPVDGPAGPLAGVRVEQGRNEIRNGVRTRIDVTQDPKFQLVQEIEEIERSQAKHSELRTSAPRPSYQVKRTYRQGQI